MRALPDAPAGAAPPLAQVVAVAAQAWERLRAGQSFDAALAAALAAAPHPPGAVPAARLAAATRDVVYGCARRRALIDALVARLATRRPDPALEALVGVALGLLLARAYADHTVVDQAVVAARAARALRPASGFVNAVLRAFLRSADALVAACNADPAVRCNLPDWWLGRLQQAYPDDWTGIVAVQAEPPPLVVRVNGRRIGVAAYLERLAAADIAATPLGAAAVWLHRPRPVEAILGFGEGLVSVQDAGAQLAAPWLEATAGMRVLDACAAPGGKTAHLLELADVAVDALDSDAARATRIESNLARLGLERAAGSRAARVLVADGRRPAAFWDGRPYDRILLDAPCTGSGVVRRHPDIPWLRRNTDVVELATQQAALLDALWPLLAPTGRLLYVVCSVFADEGQRQAFEFAQRHPDARPRALAGTAATTLQLLPRAWSERGADDRGPGQHDGFFFALFEKHRP